MVLELSSVRRPNLVARLEYENKGFEPRLAVLTVSAATVETAGLLHDTRIIEISGNRDDDGKKIVQFVRETFLEQ